MGLHGHNSSHNGEDTIKPKKMVKQKSKMKPMRPLTGFFSGTVDFNNPSRKPL